MSDTAGGITAVLPTYNRLPALKETLMGFLAMRELAELVVVDDGSSDGTAEFLAALRHPRLRVIRHGRNRGAPAARNTGVSAAKTHWVLFLEDDCQFPRDYALHLLRAAEERDADIAAAPWLHVEPHRYEEACSRGRSDPVERVDFHTGVGRFPRETTETPFLCALALVRREVLTEIKYDSDYRVNAWREETDFYLRAVEAGYRAVLTPTTASCQVRQWSGGQQRQRWYYEWWVVQNNWRFLRRHKPVLRSYGVRSIGAEQARFVLQRLHALARHYAVLVRDSAARRGSEPARLGA